MSHKFPFSITTNHVSGLGSSQTSHPGEIYDFNIKFTKSPKGEITAEGQATLLRVIDKNWVMEEDFFIKTERESLRPKGRSFRKTTDSPD